MITMSEIDSCSIINLHTNMKPCITFRLRQHSVGHGHIEIVAI